MKIKFLDNTFAFRMFSSVLGIFVVLSIFFIIFQYQRESEYKVDILNNRLQVVNYQASSVWPDTLTILPPSCRLTVLDLEGNVLYDSEVLASLMDNHLGRREVQKALKSGNGYDIMRSSASTGEDFFYSANVFGDKGIIVRSALPYNSQLYKDLRIDKSFVLVIISITIILCLVLFQIASRLARSERQRVEDEKHELKRQLTHNAAHELKTPTASISAYLETMLSHPELSEEQRRHFLERSFSQCQRMTNILSDMSALSKMDEVQQIKSPVRIQVKAVVESIAEDSAIALEEAGMEIRVNMDDVIVMGDTSLVYSIFRNLIDNAIAYAGRDTTVTISASEIEDSMVEFYVSDNGTGVSKQHLQHLCERFYRIDAGRSRKVGGTGLGLSIVKNAVLLHGGQISVMQTPGGGLTVRFTLPSRI